jgi:ATP synthase I chain
VTATKLSATARIERMNVILAVVMTSLAGLLWGAPGMLAAAAGGVLGCANFVVLRRLGAKAVAGVAAGDAGRAFALGGALVAKMTVLFALVWMAVRVAHLAVLPFALGLSGFVVSVVLFGLQAGGAEVEA